MAVQTNSDERRSLVAFLTSVARFMSRQLPDAKRFAEPFDDSWWNRASVSGLRMAARDFVEWCQDLPEAVVQQLDSELDVAGAPTLTAMRGRDRRQLLALLRRGRIQSEREWHMVNSVLADTADKTLSAIQRKRASQLLGEYEALRGPKST